MRAMQVTAYDQPLSRARVWKCPCPPLAKVLIKVETCGLTLAICLMIKALPAKAPASALYTGDGNWRQRCRPWAEGVTDLCRRSSVIAA